jgi:hypothetical protein
VPLCQLNKGTAIQGALLVAPFVVPLIYAFYSQFLYETKLFLLTKTTQKQQQLILEIFDQQKDGVILMKNSAESSQNSSVENVLFKNNILADILPNNELDKKCFKPKHQDGLEESDMFIESVSIKQIISGPEQMLNTIYQVSEKKEELSTS